MRAIVASFFVLLFSLSAMAEEIPASAFKYGQWVGGAYANNETGQFMHCSVYASYKSGDRLYFFVNRNKTVTVALANSGFRLVKGEKFPVTLKVDKRSPFHGQALALDQGFAILTIQDFNRAMTAFRKGYAVRIDAGNRQSVYDLKGTYQALKLAEKCVGEYLNFRQTPNSPVAPQPVSTGVDKSKLYQIATGMISEIGVRDFRFWTDEEVTKLNMGQGVFWDAPSANLIGGVYLRPVGSDGNLQATDAADLQEITGPCTGDILSGARKVEAAGVPTRELRAICSMEDLVQETIVSKVQFDDVIVYTLLLFSDPKAPSEAVEQDRRQMSEDVITRAASFLVSSD